MKKNDLMVVAPFAPPVLLIHERASAGTGGHDTRIRLLFRVLWDSEEKRGEPHACFRTFPRIGGKTEVYLKDLCPQA
jgi:hypothetical protein